jgi:predicted nucleic acid-binding protein
MSKAPLPTVYLETSVISYLTSRPSRDLIRAARQQVTRRLWEERRDAYHFVTSRLVEKEAAAGDANEAAKRLDIVSTTELLKVSREAQRLARLIMQNSNLPPKALNDAAHAAIAAVNGIEFLATWNLRHLANVVIRRTIEEACRKNGYATPLICTPDQLLGSEDEEDEFDS